MNEKLQTAAPQREVEPLAFLLAVSPEAQVGGTGDLISRPTGSGYPPEDDPA